MKDLYVSWDEYNRLIEKLAVRIYDSNWHFDAILCLARGGLRVGDVLSRLFDKPLGVLFTSSYRDNAGTSQSRLMIGEHISSAAPLPGPRWLLADDLVDSGATLVEVLPELRRRHPQLEEMRSAVIWRKGASVAQPDFYVESLPTNPWIHQPFEEYDHMRPADLKKRWGD
ncbi:MAG TPA: phosphoribosyltransferase family protein [Burkholderiaceae bacterium]|nr:phosphoribosyltransferase family protein [Burkholderiaceae bacterium]